MVGRANPGGSGSRELDQRHENPDFTSSLCLPGPLHWDCFPEPSRPVTEGSPRANPYFQRGWALFHRPWAGWDAAEHPGIRRPVKAAPFSWAWIPGGPVSEWSPWGGRNTVSGLCSPLSDYAGWIFRLAGGINGQGLALGPAFLLPFGGQRPRSGHIALMTP